MADVQTGRRTDRRTDGWVEKLADSSSDRLAVEPMNELADRENNRKTDRQRDEQKGRQTNRQSHIQIVRQGDRLNNRRTKPLIEELASMGKKIKCYGYSYTDKQRDKETEILAKRSTTEKRTDRYTVRDKDKNNRTKKQSNTASERTIQKRTE